MSRHDGDGAVFDVCLPTVRSFVEGRVINQFAMARSGSVLPCGGRCNQSGRQLGRARSAVSNHRSRRNREGAIMATKEEESYKRKLEAELKEWDAKLDQLSAKAQEATADARISYENELETLKSKRAAAHEALEELGKHSRNAWEDVKDGAQNAWHEVGKAMERVASRFK
jgi:hypothetical protein